MALPYIFFFETIDKTIHELYPIRMYYELLNSLRKTLYLKFSPIMIIFLQLKELQLTYSRPQKSCLKLMQFKIDEIFKNVTRLQISKFLNHY